LVLEGGPHRVNQQLLENAGCEITPAPVPGLDDFPPATWTTVTLVEHAGKSRGALVTIEARPFNGTKVQREFFTAFHGSMRQGWTATLQQLSEIRANDPWESLRWRQPENSQSS
jgi:hypothetical protein